MRQADAVFTLWLAAINRDDLHRARIHAEVLRGFLRGGHEPIWSPHVRNAFYAWCEECNARRDQERLDK